MFSRYFWQKAASSYTFMYGSALDLSLSTVNSERAYPTILVPFGMSSSLYKYLHKQDSYIWLLLVSNYAKHKIINVYSTGEVTAQEQLL